MKKVIIVGHWDSNYRDVERLLHAHGMAPARLTQRDGLTPIELSNSLRKLNSKNINISDVSKNEIAQGQELSEKYASKVYPIVSEFSSNQIKVNPLWNGLTMDLMLSNLEQELWGWADPHAIDLLDYWSEIDPAIHFVFVYDKPQSVLLNYSQIEKNSLDSKILEEMLSSWEYYNKDLLYFYHRNKNRCLLINGQQMIASSEDALQQVKNRIDAPWKELPDFNSQQQELVETTSLQQENQLESPLSNFIADSLIKQYSTIQSTYEELQAAANLPLFSNQLEQNETQSAINAWNDLVKQQELLITQQQLSEKLTENLVEVEKLAEERYFLITKEKNKRKESEEKYQKSINELSVNSQKIQTAYNEMAHESELILKQLHQVQETLEQHYLDNQSERKVKEQLLNEKTQLAKKNNDILKSSKEYQEKLKKLENNTKEIEEENELLLSQLHQVQVELERYYLENKTLKAKPPLYGAANRVRQQLTYRIGQTLIQNGKSVWGWLTIPCKLLKVTYQFKKERKQEQWEKLPKIAEYQDSHEAQRIKKHLSYQLGDIFLKNIKSPCGWCKMPNAILKIVRDYRVNK